MNCHYCKLECGEDWQVGDVYYCLSCYEGLCEDLWWVIVPGGE